MITYSLDPFVQKSVRDIVEKLGLKHVDVARITCVRSTGSNSRRILARIHSLPRIMQEAFSMRPHYLIEIISENFDKLSDEEKLKTIIHEILHIPKTFGGGFRHHSSHVNRKTVDSALKEYRRKSEWILAYKA